MKHAKQRDCTGISHPPAGAGSLPSTVCFCFQPYFEFGMMTRVISDGLKLPTRNHWSMIGQKGDCPALRSSRKTSPFYQAPGRPRAQQSQSPECEGILTTSHHYVILRLDSQKFDMRMDIAGRKANSFQPRSELLVLKYPMDSILVGFSCNSPHQQGQEWM